MSDGPVCRIMLELTVNDTVAIGYAIAAGRQDAREHEQWEIVKVLETLFVKIHGAAKEWMPEPLDMKPDPPEPEK